MAVQGPLYKIYMRNSQGYWYYQDELGTIQYSADKTEIKSAPDGWMQMIASIIRNKQYRGSFRKVGTPLKFTKDGKAIIDYIAVYEGVNAYVELIIEIQKQEDFGYELFFNGTLDFDEGYEYGDDFTTINIKEILALDMIEAKKDVVVSIPLTDDNSGYIQMDGIDLLYKSQFGISDSFSTTSGWNTGRHFVELYTITDENPNTKPTSRIKFDTLDNSLAATGQHCYEEKVNAKVKCIWDFKIRATWLSSGIMPPADFVLRYNIFIIKSNGTVINTPSNVIYYRQGITNVFGTSYLSGRDHSIKGEMILDMEPGDKLYFVNAASPVGSSSDKQMAVYYYPTPALFTIESTKRAEATIHRFIKPWKLWQELINILSDGKFSGVSPYLFADDNQVLISGTALRREADPVFQTTINDFLKYCWVNKRAVLKDINGKNALIAEFSETFNNQVIADLAEIADFTWSFEKDDLISSIVVGYENIDFGVDGQINGKDEYNQKNYFTTAQETINATYEIVSPYIASMYAQELLRVNFAGKTTTDNKGDNKVYLVDAVKGTTIQYYSGQIQFLGGNQIRLTGTYGDMTGKQLKITGTGAQDGVYDITNTSYLFVGYTSLFISGTVTDQTSAGVITYDDPNVYQPYRPVYASITGCLSPTSAYNTRITPKDILMLHAPIIAAGVYNVNASDALDVIKFRSGDKNVELSVSLDGVKFVTQNADERFSQLAQPFTLPIKFSFKTKYEKDLFSQLYGDKRYGLVKFTVHGITLTGYVDEIHTNADSREAQTWQLKSTVSTNLLNLLTWRRL